MITRYVQKKEANKWMDKRTAGEKLTALRGKRTQSVVAKALGISVSALSMYERGERTPRDEVKQRMAQYYHQTVEQIFFAK